MDFYREGAAELKKYAYAWITILFFAVSIFGHWVFGGYAYVHEADQHGQPPVFSEFAIEIARDTMENWQSEFL